MTDNSKTVDNRVKLGRFGQGGHKQVKHMLDTFDLVMFNKVLGASLDELPEVI